MLVFKGDNQISIDYEGKNKLAKDIEDLANELFEELFEINLKCIYFN